MGSSHQDQDNDNDSVSLASTEVEESYNIEAIIAEKVTKAGKFYLVKWEGYDHSECTWEPKSSFHDPETIEDWTARAAIGEGLTSSQLEDVEGQMNRRVQAQARRKERRRKERRKRRLARNGRITSPENPSSDETPLSQAREPRKPIATFSSAPSTPVIEILDDDEAGILQAKKLSCGVIPTVPKANVATPPHLQSRKSGAISMTVEPRKDRVTRIITPGDPTKFNSLRTQGRQQRYDREDHRIPDADSLAFLDPSTGAVSVPAQKPSPVSIPVTESAGPNIAQAAFYPVNAVKQRIKPRNVDDVRARRTHTAPEIPQLGARGEPGNAPDIVRPRDGDIQWNSPQWLKENVMCRNWYRGNCKFDDCRFAHKKTPYLQPKKSVVCEYWKHGQKCKYSAYTCERYHTFPDRITGKFKAPEEPQPSSDADFLPVDKRPEQFLPLRDIVCRFWYQGNCQKSADNCPHAHRACAFITSKKDRSCSFWRKGQCMWLDSQCQYYHCEFDSEGHPVRPRKHRTCADWRNDRCPHDADQCTAYHVIFDPNDRSRNQEASSDRIVGPGDAMALDDSSISDSLLFEPMNSIPGTISGDQGDWRIDVKLNVGTNKPFHSDRKTMSILRLCSIADLDTLSDGAVVTQIGTVTAASSDMSLHQFHFHLGDAANVALAIDVSLDNECILIFSGVTSNLDEQQAAKIQTLLTKADCNSPPSPNGLNFCVIKSVQLRTALTINEMAASAHNLVASIDHAYAPETKRWIEQGNQVCTKKIVFLMFPYPHEAEMRLLTMVLQDKGMTVYQPSSESWTDFCKISNDGKDAKVQGGIIIWHPSLINYWDVPHMRSMLWRSINHFRMDREGDSTTYTRLFPRGKAVFLTDDLFVEDPVCAAEIIRSFHKIISARPSHDREDRIYARPKLLEWICILYAASETQSEVQKAYKQMIPLVHDLISSTSYGGLAETEPVITSPPPELYPSYDTIWDTDPRYATEILLQEFVLWTTAQTEKLRRFSTVTTTWTETEQYEIPDGSEPGELESSYGVATPRTPMTPAIGSEADQTGKHEDSRLRNWSKRYTHIWFLTGEKYLDQAKR